MILAELRNQLKQSHKLREMFAALYDHLSDVADELRRIDPNAMKVLDIEQFKDTIQAALETVVERTENIDDADHTLHAQITATMKKGRGD